MQPISQAMNGTGTACSPIQNNDISMMPLEQNTPTVLIADDNDVVGQFLQEVFRAYGYKTLLAVTRDQAIDHCKREGDSIYALIADVRLGTNDGFETAQMLKAQNPDMKVILISGYPREHLVRTGLLPAELKTGVFLQKPFLPRDLLSMLGPVRPLA